MSHLDEGQLHELLDGELDEAARAAALAHLATCERCKAAYDEAAAFVAEADSLVDAVQLPDVRIIAVEPAAVPIDVARKKRMTIYRSLAWAASIVVAVGIGWSTGAAPRAPAKAAESAPAETMRDEIAVAPAVTPMAEKSADQPTATQQSAPRQVAPTDARAKRMPEPVVAPEESKATADLARLEGGNRNQAAPSAAAPPPAPATAAGVDAGPERRDAAARGRVLAEQEASALSAFASADRSVMPLTTPTAFRVISMEESVRILGGSIRLIDGMTPVRFLTGRGSGSTLVRVVYEDPPGRELWLDQGRVSGEADKQKPGATTLLSGDTLLVVKESGTRSLGWVDQHGFLLRLTGYLSGDSLQGIQAKVR